MLILLLFDLHGEFIANECIEKGYFELKKLVLVHALYFLDEGSLRYELED